ncbi:MAG TPA: exonuclease SbcCD subunit D [Pyrinomonadaceae bacterium]|nr:exonuclease SbcCD subunit D [Pyrinomonadaceae bacterium]
MKFLHLADVHLGCRRYNLEERTKDFFRAWNDVIRNHAIANRVDFILVAGDFFDRRNVEPQAMNHAIAGLEQLKEAGIPVVTIEGNHDQRGATSDFSWLRSLSQWGFIKLLEPGRDEEGHIELVPWNEEERAGSYIDIADARIFGSNWYGTSATAAIPVLADALRRSISDGRFNILMLHTDVEGHTIRPMIPALPLAKLNELKQLVHYVALGHTHKNFSLDNWAFNPGSLEPTSIDEYREERGAYLVEVDEHRNIKAEHIRDYIQRPFQRLSFDVSGARDADEVFDGVLEKVKQEGRVHKSESDEPAPIIEITLRGHLGFKNSLLNMNRMREEAQGLTGALHVMIRNQSVPVEYAVAAGMDVNAPREEREMRIIEDLIARDNRYKSRAHEFARLVVKAKQQALGDEEPEKILELISQTLEGQAVGETAETAGDRKPDDDQQSPTAAALSAIERSAATAVMSDK